MARLLNRTSLFVRTITKMTEFKPIICLSRIADIQKCHRVWSKCTIYNNDNEISSCSLIINIPNKEKAEPCFHSLRPGLTDIIFFLSLNYVINILSAQAPVFGLAPHLHLCGKKKIRLYSGFSSRGDKIWTCGLCVPNAALYQTEPRLENKTSSTYLLLQSPDTEKLSLAWKKKAPTPWLNVHRTSAQCASGDSNPEHPD